MDANDDRTIVADDADGDGFWMVKEEVAPAQVISTEPDTLLDEPEDLEKVVHVYTEGAELHLQWSGPEGWVRDNWADLLFEEEMACAVIMLAKKDSAPHTELYNSGATRHISPYQSNFTSYTPLSPPVYLNTANQQCFPAVGTRTLAIRVPNKGTKSQLALHNALHMLSVAYTLVSIGSLDLEGYHFHIGDSRLEIDSPEGERVGRVPLTQQRLYKVACSLESANTVEPLSVMELHCCMGHIAMASACKLVESRAVTGVDLDPNSQERDCNTCIFTCTTHLPVPKVRISPQAWNFSDHIHTNVWGPMSISTCKGHQYFITFTDDTTHFTITYLMHTKDKALDAYKLFEAWAITQGHYTAIKVLCSDCRGKYLSNTFNAHLMAAGTARKLTVHNTLQLNGVAEHLNRTLLERIHAFAHESGLPKSLWGEALRHVVWLKNRTATHALDSKTPFEALYSRLLDLSALRVWGCQVWVYDPDGSKLDVCVREVRWLGFDVDV